MDQNNSQTAKIAGGIVMTAIVMIGIYFFILHSKPSPTSSSTFSATPSEMLSGTTSNNTSSAAQSTTPDATTKTTSPVASSTPGTGFKDGSYSAVSSYQVPGGQNAIKVSVRVKDDIITSLSTQDSYSDHESAGYISSFKNGLSDQVVGKRIDNINLSRFNGASDTSDGFDQALLQIIGQAKTS